MSDCLFFNLKEGRASQVPEEQFDPQDTAVCYLTPEKFRALSARMGLDENILSDLSFEKGNFRSSLDVYEDASAGFLNIINVDDLDGEMDRVMFVIRHKLLCLVRIEDGDGSESGLFVSILAQEKQNSSPARVFYRFLERLLRAAA